VDQSGCPYTIVNMRAVPDYFSKPGDNADIIVKLSGSDGSVHAGRPVILTGPGITMNAVTDGSGTARFRVNHMDKNKISYNYVLTAENIRKRLTIPVNRLRVVFEKNPATGRPFTGVAADGKSFVEINIDTTGMGPGLLRIEKPGFGRIECGSTGSQCKVVRMSNNQVTLKYYPPAYLRQKNFNAQVAFTNEARAATSSAIASGTIYFNNARAPWAVRDTIRLNFENSKGIKLAFASDILAVRPPVMLVHGFFGGRTTWKNLQMYLGGERFDPVIDEYYAGDQDIHDQSKALMANISRELARYRAFDLKCFRVDIVGHSMGGLIARNYIKGSATGMMSASL